MNLSEIQNKLAELNNWELKIDSLEKIFFLKSIEELKIFTSKILDLSEKMNHFPLIFIDRQILKISLNSGKEGITEKDFLLAKEIDKIRG
jgi:pterin-4a-carbinolamine dehydratase